MKRIIILSMVLIVLTIIVVGIIVVVVKNNGRNTESFDVSEYAYEIDAFAIQESFGPIVSEKFLLENVERLWIREFGDDIKQEKPYEVSYDNKNGVWLVQGTLQPNLEGGVAYILVDNNSGKVLAVWHEK